MLRMASLLAVKDLRLVLGRGSGLAQGVLLGLLILFIFSLSKGIGEVATPREAAAIFWLGSIFCEVLIFNQLYSLEETNSAREGLLLAPGSSRGIWLGKALGGFLLLAVAQIIFIPATIVFLEQTPSGPSWPGLCSILMADMGICALGALLGALASGNGARESLLSIIIFPLLVPLLLAAIGLSSISLGATDSQAPGEWLGLGCAFDAIFIGASILLSSFMNSGDD